ncbi:MAG: ribonuclease P protein component [Bacteroidetes bacterium]|nr:ribonuclease P protein component [Bacteroidota bacterium]
MKETKIASLKNKKLISDLFKSSNTIKVYPLKLYFLNGNDYDVNEDKVLYSVPKKIIKRAIERNLIKRRIKESLRSQFEILKIKKQTLILGFVYIGNNKQEEKYNKSFTAIFNSINNILSKLKLILINKD